MYLEVKKAKLVPDKYGSKIEISMVGLYNWEWRRVKRMKLDEDILYSILSTTIDIDAITHGNTSKKAQSTQPDLL